MCILDSWFVRPRCVIMVMRKYFVCVCVCDLPTSFLTFIWNSWFVRPSSIIREHFVWGCMCDLPLSPGGGGTDLERGYGDVRPRRPPFHASPAARKGPISSKRVSLQDPLLRKFGKFSLNSLIFTKILAHKPPNLEIFSSQAPKFGNIRSQAPLFWGKCQFASPTLRKSGPHTPTWKKVECPPPGPCLSLLSIYF